jgi:Skp family chaperone for outer membrane proteins
MNRKLTAATVFAALFAGSIAFIGGCNKEEGGGKSDTAAERVGIVDLDKVAIDLGWKAKLETNQKTYMDKLKNELVQIANMYRKQMVDKKASFAPGEKDQLTTEQQQTLMNMIGAYNQIVQQLDQQAGQRYQEYGQVSMARYREALTPIVRQVAQEKHVGVVMTQLGNIIYADPALDITNAVVDAARKTPPALTDVPMNDLSGAPADLPSQLPAGTTQPSMGGATTKPSTNP